MSAKLLHFGRPMLTAALAALGTLTLVGCQAIVSSTPEAQVRVIHATPDTPGLDIYQGPNALAFNLSFGAVTSYVPLSPGVYTINADTAGSRQVLSTAKSTFAPDLVLSSGEESVPAAVDRVMSLLAVRTLFPALKRNNGHRG